LYDTLQRSERQRRPSGTERTQGVDSIAVLQFVGVQLS
jgi:hypothetical protein